MLEMEVDEVVDQENYWDKHLDTQLVKYIQRRRCIWDPTHGSYTSRARRNQVYSDFAGKYGPHISSEAVKERWVNIRSTFSCILRKLEAAKNSNKQYSPTWHLWELCQFLLDVKKRHRSKPNPTNSDIKFEKASDIEEEYKSFPTEENTTNVHFADCSNGPIQETLTCEDVVNGIVQAFDNIQSGIYGNDEPAEIGRLIIERMSDMNSFEVATMASKIMNVLLLYDANNPDNPINCNNES